MMTSAFRDGWAPPSVSSLHKVRFLSASITKEAASSEGREEPLTLKGMGVLFVLLNSACSCSKAAKRCSRCEKTSSDKVAVARSVIRVGGPKRLTKPVIDRDSWLTVKALS